MYTMRLSFYNLTKIFMFCFFYNRTAFLACSVQAISRRFGTAELATDDLTTEDMRKQMTDKEWDKVR